METNWWSHANLSAESERVKSSLKKQKKSKVEKIERVFSIEKAMNKPKKGGLTDDCI